MTFTQHEGDFNIHLVVWQFWGRAAEASWTEKVEGAFLIGLSTTGRMVSARSPAGRAISAHFQPRNQHAESAIFLHLLFQLLKTVAHKLGDLAAAQASHVDVVALQFALVVVAFAVDVHQVEFVDQPLPLEQPQGAVDRAAVDAGIDLLRLAQDLAGVQMLLGGFHHAQDGAPLLRHAEPALGEVGLESARHFGLR